MYASLTRWLVNRLMALSRAHCQHLHAKLPSGKSHPYGFFDLYGSWTLTTSSHLNVSESHNGVLESRTLTYIICLEKTYTSQYCITCRLLYVLQWLIHESYCINPVSQGGGTLSLTPRASVCEARGERQNCMKHRCNVKANCTRTLVTGVEVFFALCSRGQRIGLSSVISGQA